ncbi:phosphatidylserine decarboxylase [Peribacillus psychrosaccharolyticus]|uniref:Phosphatidylserine decarboxylase proenzyme n=1 Tax=Peribacillus psychrosaccharolyticus TaxID=1407 RepID=A0A974RZS5_PERPY|nr:phosphatidylserine decarboxylase [Peribacillus psychrosaccharolyticus]MEC2054368.1 phosphatidylserine decarboxylase [Peribacillus psychrosaccharolyticus]MED3744404.1 phosphatidylserine decarboxylase [Peribacillus psychrosaccharolyticus]QQS99876.1 phosphatidylserine decarboxylase [Peribacillus psychrosaccharolyticus]
MYQSLYRFFIELTNGRITSGALKRFADSKLSKPLIPSFVKVFNINKEESKEEISSFNTLHDLFTRTLKEGSRHITEDASAVVSPVDGVFEDIGEINADKQIVVKDKIYSIEEMLGNSEALPKYLGGTYMVLYLSPSHYHRIHSPVTGTVNNRWVLGQKSYPVNRLGMKYGQAPLSKNYRHITEMQHQFGHLAVVKVGAMFINSIVITEEAKELAKGQEMAYFSFGSTVVLLFEQGTFEPLQDIQLPAEVRLGQTLGHLR